jgi:predicted aconitase
MELTEHEQAMLGGAEGWPVQKGMEILCQMGELYGAKRMLPVKNVHMVNASVYLAGNAVVKLAEKMLAEGARFKTDTTLNPASVDLDCWKGYGFTENIYNQQKYLTGLFRKMGAITVHCCSPYLVGQVPRFSEHCCWGESSAVIYANSVLGARTNRNGGPAGLAASLTGVVPDYGYHRDENRYGQVIVEVEAKINEIADYGILGFYVGDIVSDGVPVFTGLPHDVSNDALKQLGSALATTGAVALFHVAGVTPEAPTLEAAMGLRKPDKGIKVTK